MTVVCVCRRWLLVRAGGHRELDQDAEPLQPYDQPAAADHAAHPQPHAQNGHLPLDQQPVISYASHALSRNRTVLKPGLSCFPPQCEKL